MQIIANHFVDAVVGEREPTIDLRQSRPMALEGKHGGIRIARLDFETREVDALLFEPRRRSGLQASESKPDGLQGPGELDGSFFARTAGTKLLLPQMAESIQESAGSQNDAGRVDPIAGSGFDAGDSVPNSQQGRSLCLDDREAVLTMEPMLHLLPVEFLVALGSRSLDGGAATPIEQAEMDSVGIPHLADEAPQRIDLPNQVALADAPDGRVARHLGNHFPVDGDQGGIGAHSGRSGRRLATRVSAPNDNDVDREIGHGGECLAFPDAGSQTDPDRKGVLLGTDLQRTQKLFVLARQLKPHR